MASTRRSDLRLQQSVLPPAHRVIQMWIGNELKKQYPPAPELSPALLEVLSRLSASKPPG
ncbi:MAG: hypothetical protein ACJ8F3_20930 [Xanthobacteraceae bacterium]